MAGTGNSTKRSGAFAAGRALDYCLRALAYLAQETSPKSSKDISRSCGIPRDYLIQLMQPLRNAGFVVARAGKHGGFELCCEPDKVSVAEVVDALGGWACPPDAGAEARAVNAAVRGRLEGMALGDLLNDRLDN